MQVPLLPLALSLAACTSVEAPTPAHERHALASDGVELAYEELGAGEPLLVFVHGWCGERGVWRGTLERFASTHRVLALDLAGHGESGAARAQWTLASLADDVAAVIAASGATGDVILIGHSLGAPVALLAAPKLAPRVRGVIAVDSLHDADFAYPPGFLADAERALAADFPRALEASIRGAAGPTLARARVDWLLARAARTDHAAALGLLQGMADFSPAEALRAAGVPVRVINATHSGTAPAPGLVTEVAKNRRYADFDALLLEGVGHFPMLERPAEFQAALARWIAALERGAG